MAHAGKECGFGDVGRFGLLLGAKQFVGSLFLGGDVPHADEQHRPPVQPRLAERHGGPEFGAVEPAVPPFEPVGAGVQGFGHLGGGSLGGTLAIRLPFRRQIEWRAADNLVTMAPKQVFCGLIAGGNDALVQQQVGIGRVFEQDPVTLLAFS